MEKKMVNCLQLILSQSLPFMCFKIVPLGKCFRAVIAWIWFFTSMNPFMILKVERVLKGSLDSIPSPSPSVKIQNYRQESLLEVMRQNIAGWCQQTFCFQKFVDYAQHCFAFTPQANFLAHNLNFHWRWRWWDQIQATF